MRRAVGGPFLPSRSGGTGSIAASNRGARFCSASQGSIPCTNLAISEGLCENHLKRAASNVPLRPLTGQSSRDVAGGSNSPGSGASSLGLSINGSSSSNVPSSSSSSSLSSAAGAKDGKFSIVGSSVSRRVDDQKQNGGTNDGSARTPATATTTTRAAGRTKRRTLHGAQQLPPTGGSPVGSSSSVVSSVAVRSQSPSFGVSQSQPSLHGASSSSSISSASGGLTLGGGPNSVAAPPSSSSSSGGHSPKMGHVGRRGVNGSPNQYGATATSAIGRNAAAGNSTTGKPGRWAAEAAARSLPPLAAATSSGVIVPNNNASISHTTSNNNASVLTTSSSSGSLSRPGSRPTTAGGHGHTTINGAPSPSSVISVAITPITSNSATNAPSLSLPLSTGGSAISSGSMAGASPIASLQAPNNSNNNNNATSSLASMVSSSSSDEEHNGPHSTLARLLVSTDHRTASNAPLLSSPSHSNQSESTSSSPSNGTRLRDQSNDGATTGRSVTIAGANTARRKRRQTRDRQSAHKSGSIEGPLPAPIGTVGISDFLYLAELMATCTSPDAFFPRVVEACHHLVHAEMTNIFMVQTAAGKSELLCVASKTFPTSPSASREQKSLINVKLPLDSGLAGHVYSTGRAMCLRDAHKDWRFHENDTSLRGVMVQSVLVVPVRGDEGKVVGVIECINADQALGFTTNDDSNIKALAGCLSTMLRKTDLDREVNMRRKQTEALHHISAIISAELGVRRVIDRIVQACRLVVSAQCIRVWVLDDITRELVLSAQVAPGNERGAGNTTSSDTYGNNGTGNNNDVKWTWNEDNPERIKFTEGILGNVALTGGTANVVDVTKDWRYESEKKRDRRQGPQVKAMLATAVKDYLAGRTIAVLECINKPLRDQVQSFTADDETLLSSIASTAASVLRQAQLYEEAVRIRKQTEALKNIIELMSADIGTGMLVTRIIDASYKLVDAERITLFTVEDMEDDENKDAKEAPKAKRGADVHKRDKSVVASALLREEPPTKTLVCIVSKDENMRGMRVPWGAGIVGHVGLTLKSLNIPNAYEDSRFDKEADKRTGFHTKSILTVPVVDQLGAGVAVIQAVNKRSAGGAFLADDVRALESLAASAGIILQKSKMYHATVCAERKNRALVQLLKVVTQEESALSTIIDGITRVTYDVLDADRISIYFVDTRRAELFSIVSQETQGVRFKFGTGIAGYVADKGIPVNCKNVYLDPRFDSTFDEKTGYRTKSMLCMPVKDSDGNVLAVVQALNKARVHVTSRMTISMSMTINMDQQQHSPTSPVLIGGKSSSSNGGGPSSGNFATGRQSMSARDGLSVPNRASSAIGALGSPTTGSGQAFTHFTDDDMNILSAICEQIRDSIRKCRIEAIAEHAGAADDKVSSLLDLYSDQTRKRGGNGNGTPRGGAAAAGGGGAAEYGYPKTPSSGAAKASAGVFASMTGPQESTVVMQRTSYVWPVMTSLASGASSEQLAALCDRKFNVFDYSEDQLLGFSYVIFHQTGFLDTYIDGGRLKQFLLSVRKKYRNNPFHNWYHGFSALQFTYYLLKTCAAHSTLITHDVLGLLIGALCHDIDHPGFTNQFEIMSSSDLARVHNDQSVLENHHAYTLFHILRQKECNVFEKFSQSTQRELRRCLIGGILATDMVHHSEATKKLSGVTDMKSFDYTVEADRQQVVNMIIHTADLSAQAYPRLVAKSWEERIVREFQNEVTHEERLGIPVAKFMQGLDDPRLRAGLQVNFILYVLIPWWSNVARLMPELQPMLDELRANREYYDGISAGTIAPPRDTLDAHAPLPTIAHPSNPMVTFRPGSAGGGMTHHATNSGNGSNTSHGMPSLHLSSLSVNTGDVTASSPRPVWPDGASGDSPAAANDTHMAIRVTASDGTAAVPTSSAHPSRNIR